MRDSHASAAACETSAASARFPSMTEKLEPIHAPDSTIGVRQGRRGGIVRTVLFVSMALAVVAMVAVLVFA